MGQVAILGGTFDPVHCGHLLLAQTALSQLGLDRVIWLPTRNPPHKRGLNYEQRRLMVECAIADNPAFVLDPLGTGHRTNPDYAIGTLIELQYIYPNCQWYWIIGLDAFQTLPRWYHRETLIPACEWLVAPRSTLVTSTAAFFSKSDSPQQKIDIQTSLLCKQVVQQLASQDISIRWQLLQMPPVGISSSLIRQYCCQGRSIRYLVPEEVRTYITTHNLYLD
jgi:nicotinate-nucleotide adenylyltransferase